MTVKLKPITEKSWLVLDDTGEIRIGLLTEIREQYILMAKGEKQKFLDKHAVNKFFNEDVFDNIETQVEIEDVKKEYFINGYPVDFDGPNEVIMKGVNLPLFSKKTTSNVYYCAGYYCLKFPNNWRIAYCPKLSTLQSYEYTGPYKSDLEVKAAYLQ
ncbi:MAG TPA: hypothetical protein VIY47_01755, partial [Ignavibacteriaceae bacterium]